jgi:hypothetical protein
VNVHAKTALTEPARSPGVGSYQEQGQKRPGRLTLKRQVTGSRPARCHANRLLAVFSAGVTVVESSPYVEMLKDLHAYSKRRQR